MTHLSGDELIDAAEGRVVRPDHLADCAACREQVRELAGALREASGIEVPEPSPLFWQHFSARVSEAVRQDRSRSRWRWPVWRVVVPALGALLLLLVIGRLGPRLPSSPAASRPRAVAAAPAAAPVDVSMADDDAWQTFSAIATEADPAGAGFSSPAPGLADDAVLQMTDEERGELIRLLEVELARNVRGRG